MKAASNPTAAPLTAPLASSTGSQYLAHYPSTAAAATVWQMMCAVPPAILKPVMLNLCVFESNSITRKDPAAPERENTSEKGAENKRDDSSILVKFTARAPLISPFAIYKSATAFANPGFMPGTKITGGIRLSR